MSERLLDCSSLDRNSYDLLVVGAGIFGLASNPIIFRELNLVVATGGSRSGVMKSDAIGRIAATLLLNEPIAVPRGGEK